MKILFILGFLFTSAAVSAQVVIELPFKSATELLKSKPIPGKMEFQFPSAMEGLEPAQYYAAKVIRLPLDNMPCLVPDVKGFNMPVAGSTLTGSFNMPVLKTIPVK
ncbi:MAG: hypothetical protein H7Y86_17595 [Rhizobacter sp.]|nr:hypothetical protein [Ferruginibacter sp.]